MNYPHSKLRGIKIFHRQLVENIDLVNFSAGNKINRRDIAFQIDQ